MHCEAVAVGKAQARQGLGIVFNLRGQAYEASREWQRALSLGAGSKFKNPRSPVRVEPWHSPVIQKGDFGKCTRALPCCADLSAQVRNDIVTPGPQWSNSLSSSTFAGNCRKALTAAAQARDLKEQIDDVLGWQCGHYTRSSILLALEDYDQCADNLQKTRFRSENSVTGRLLAAISNTLGTNQVAQGPSGRSGWQRLQAYSRFTGSGRGYITDARCALPFGSALLALGQVESSQSEWNCPE